MQTQEIEVRASWLLGFGLLVGVGLASYAAAEETHRRPDGFWKCRVGDKAHSEFNGEDLVGLASGQHIPTDCAYHWLSSAGKTYCFASTPSFLEFQDHPELLQKAEAFTAQVVEPQKDLLNEDDGPRVLLPTIFIVCFHGGPKPCEPCCAACGSSDARRRRGGEA